MSQILPKNKEKRPRTSSNEANNSFVKNVTSRVTGLLPTLTKWFSSPSSSNGNGSAPTGDASDSSEDESPEIPVITQPPAKRMRFNTPGTYNHYGPTDASCSTSDVDILEMPYSPFSGTQYAQSSRNTLPPPPLRPPNEDHTVETAHVFKMPHTVSNVGQSIANKRKSIFDTTTNAKSAKIIAKTSTNSIRDPSFKPSLLGSPFYPGRTRYGGASSPYIDQPNIKQQTMAVVNEPKSNDDTAISSSARRVMDLLESYSSPLMEARRVPVYTKPKNDGFSDRYSPYTNKVFSYKTQELYVPSIASIMQVKRKSRLMDTTNAARQIIASHSSASSYPAYPTASKGNEPETEQANKMTTKVKSRITRTNRGHQDDIDSATPVKLPSAVLQIDQDKMPTFSFGTPAVSKLPNTSTPKIIFPTANKNNTQASTSKHETVTSSVFKFSNPVKVSSDTPQASPTPLKFTFASPDRQMDQKLENKRDDCSVVVGIVKEPEKSTTKSKDWQCSDCWVKNKPEASKCVCCGSKQLSQNAKCSVCKLADSQSQKDKCANCANISVFQVASPLTAKTTGVSQSSKWKCDECWISNDNSAEKCDCCGASRPKKSSGAPVTATITSMPATVTSMTTMATTQMPTLISNTQTLKAPVSTKVDADWKCNDCWISNKSSVEKCAACGGARPGAKQISTIDAPANTISLFGSTNNKFKTITKTQKSETWDCSCCLVQNNINRETCACCDKERENKNIPAIKFNFSSTKNSSFKFGVDPKVQEAMIAKKAEVIPTLESKLEAQSETNNNILAEPPTFTFNLPAKKVENKIDVPKTKSDDTPKMNFTFGIPKQTPTSAVVTTKLLESSKDKEEEKLQEVPSVDLNSPLQEKPKPLGGIMTQLKQLDNENKTLPLPSASLFNPVVADANKEKPSNSITLPAASKIETPTPTFSFGAKTASANLFDNAPSSSTSKNMFTQPSQAITLPTTSAPTLSLFKPPETSTSTTSLFQQPDLAAKPAQLFQSSEKTNNAATATPLFSFGNNGPSNPVPPPALSLNSAPEKPKFQFTFGSNTTPKTDPPAMFQSPFGSTESNVNANSFTLPAGTTLGSSNTLSTSTLGGSNGLPATNGLTGNALGGSSLAIGNSAAMNNTLGGANGLTTNALSGANGLQPGNPLTTGATGLFNSPLQKENVWSTSNNTPTSNLFVSSTTTSSLQKPQTFTFGSSTPFNVTNNTPTFGSPAAPQQNMFGMANQNNNAQPSMFSNAVQSQPTGNLFGSPQPASNPAPQMPMFGTPSIGATPTFGSPNPSLPTFEAPSLTSTPAPAFNFGSQSTGVFGFGQQQQLQQQQQHIQQQQLQQQQSPQQTGVYSFGGAPAGAPNVQFRIGTGANPAVRRVRKAVRRNPQR